MAEERKTLTLEQADKVWRAINLARQSDDRDPQEVIAKDYNGDEERYLRVMANWHNVKLD